MNQNSNEARRTSTRLPKRRWTRRYFGMTGLQVGILIGLAAMGFGGLGLLAYLVLSDANSSSVIQAAALPSATTTATPTAISLPSATITATPTAISFNTPTSVTSVPFRVEAGDYFFNRALNSVAGSKYIIRSTVAVVWVSEPRGNARIAGATDQLCYDYTFSANQSNGIRVDDVHRAIVIYKKNGNMGYKQLDTETCP